jgi:SulP family sulfate permease
MSFPPSLMRFFPFLRWFPYQSASLRADFLAGLTVALVLVPQSMAYAQLAGMPAYYGLYAAFLPVAVAALWGSSNQLGTGPVAVASLLTASALTPLAAPGSESFIALAIMLALLVGLIQLSLGVFKLGVVVNFLSHPVIVGFTNAAAIIIALSQVNKLLGVPMGRSESFIVDIWGVAKLVGRYPLPHAGDGAGGDRPDLGDPQEGAEAARRADRRGPDHAGVLADRLRAQRHGDAGTDRRRRGANPAGRVRPYRSAHPRINEQIVVDKSGEMKAAEGQRRAGTRDRHAELRDRAAAPAAQGPRGREPPAQPGRAQHRLRTGGGAPGEAAKYFASGRLPAGAQSDGRHWHIARAASGSLTLTGGGEVVGKVPEGLPSVGLPKFSWDMLGSLLGRRS